ncbi:MAG: hypothetical protein JF590_00255 [Gemmatimonadetes bacterium]|nr:hypothetical protein [Gemmatimonadota bacterium]
MRAIMLAGVTGLAALAACSDGGPAATGRVEFGVATSASAPAGGAALFADTFNDSTGNALVIDSVAVVVRKLHLEGSAATGCDDGERPDTIADTTSEDGMMVSDSGDGDHEGDDGVGCEGLRLGPFLVDLPLNGGVAHEFTLTVDTGTYSEARFQIHKPEGDADNAFLAAHPEYAGVSIRVVGTFNGTPFVYKTGVTDVQHVEFDPPLVVTTGTTAFTLMVDLSGWFKGPGGVLVDPATALDDGVNAILVRQNIIRSFHGFRDEDHDGHDDSDEGH